MRKVSRRITELLAERFSYEKFKWDVSWVRYVCNTAALGQVLQALERLMKPEWYVYKARKPTYDWSRLSTSELNMLGILLEKAADSRGGPIEEQLNQATKQLAAERRLMETRAEAVARLHPNNPRRRGARA